MMSNLPEDRYTVVRSVGTGSFGEIYEATDRTTGERVAMKHIRRGTERSAGLDEISAVLSVNHPSIVRCLDFHYLGNGDTCLIYDFMAGGTLRERMVEDEPVDRTVWGNVAKVLLEALDHLHSRQILHCDLKPENVLCMPAGNAGTRYMLSDLGATRYFQTHGSLGQANIAAGSPAYMAPESFYQRFFPASDLYSLGVMLFELATGRRPFGGDIRAIARKHINNPPALEKIPDPLQRDFVRWLLNKDPADRPKSASDALRWLVSAENPDSAPATVTTAPTLSESNEPQPLDAYREGGSFEIETRSEQHISFSVRGRPVIAAVHDNHLELFDGRNGRPLNQFLPGIPNSLQLLPDGSLFSAQPGRFVVWEKDFYVPRTIFELSGSVRTAGMNREQSHVLWVEGGRAYIRSLATHESKITVVDCPAAGLRPRLLVPPKPGDADFILITGTTRPAVIWLDLSGNIVGRARLPGPVIDSSHAMFPAVLCARHDSSGSRGPALVTFPGPGELETHQHKSMPRCNCFCQNGVIHGADDGQVSFISHDTTQSLGQLDDPEASVLFDPRFRFCHIVRPSGKRLHFQYLHLP